VLGFKGTTSPGDMPVTPYLSRAPGQWQALPAVPFIIRQFAIDKNGTVYVDPFTGPTQTRAIYMLPEGGSTWEPVTVPTEPFSSMPFTLHADGPGDSVYVVSYGEALFRKAADGAAFEQIVDLGVEPYGGVERFDSDSRGNVLFTSSQAIFKLAPGGTTLEKVADKPAEDGVPAGVANMSFAAFDDNDDFTADLYHGNQEQPPTWSMYRLTDGKGSWHGVAQYSGMGIVPIVASDGDMYFAGSIGGSTWSIARLK